MALWRSIEGLPLRILLRAIMVVKGKYGFCHGLFREMKGSHGAIMTIRGMHRVIVDPRDEVAQ